MEIIEVNRFHLQQNGMFKVFQHKIENIADSSLCGPQLLSLENFP